MADPVSVLARCAGCVAADGGAVLVVDERVADTFTAPGGEVERLMYALQRPALPAGEHGRAAVGRPGRSLRADTVRR